MVKDKEILINMLDIMKRQAEVCESITEDLAELRDRLDDVELMQAIDDASIDALAKCIADEEDEEPALVLDFDEMIDEVVDGYRHVEYIDLQDGENLRQALVRKACGELVEKVIERLKEMGEYDDE